MKKTPLLSLIIPAYNEQNFLPALLESVKIAKANFKGSPDLIEVIVSDNDSTDNTASLAQNYGCCVVREDKRIIAAVRNAGAKVATGEILMFVDADSLIHKDTFNAVKKALESQNIIGGATGITLSRMSLGITLTYWIMVPMLWATGLDTGVVFCRKKDFETAGPYNENILFGEDVQFLMSLKKLGKTRKQKLVKLHSARAVTSSRKFDQHGDWHYFPIFARGFLGLFTSFSRFNGFAKKYWYGKQRDNADN